MLIHNLMYVNEIWYVLSIFSNQKRRALKCCEDLSNFQPVNSHLRPLRSFLDDHCCRNVRTSLKVRRFRFEPPNDCNTKYIRIYITIYTNIYKYIQDIQDIYNIPGGGQAAAARPGPEAPGPRPPSRRLVCCIYLVYICIYFDIFWYQIDMFLY